MVDTESTDVQITVSFVTKLPAKFRVPEQGIAVPANLTRLGLSQIVNHLLAFDKPVPFDFLINGELLRASLGAFLAAKALSAEALLRVEYVPAFVPPKPGRVEPHLDWVSALAAPPSAAYLASGSYDGQLRFFSPTTAAEGPLLQLAAHTGAITALALRPVTASKAQGPAMLLSCGKDRLARLWEVEASTSAGGAPSVTPLATLVGHTDALQCAAASSAAQRCVTGGWDGQIRLWRFGREAREEAAEAAGAAPPSAKKQKGGAKKESVPALASLAVLGGHAQCVSGLDWCGRDHEAFFSGSWDHTVKRWDLGKGGATVSDTLNTARAVHCIAVSGHAASGSAGSSLVAFGGAEKAVRVWDPRAKGEEGQLVVRHYLSHKEWVAGLAWCPGSAHLLASVSHDGTMKVWDIRATVPLATVAAHPEAKGLAVTWLDERALATGGSDCKLQMHSTDHGAGEAAAGH